MAAKNNIDYKAILKRIWAICVHNWPWKLLSVFIAILLWSGLITQDGSLTREKTFSDVTISVINSETLRRNGYIIVDGLEDLAPIRFRANVPQGVYNTVKASNYNPRIDLSQIKGTGTQKLDIISTSTSAYGSVTEMSTSSVTVEVEEYVTRSRIPVRLSFTGEIPDTLYATSASVDPAFVTVSGPKNLVNSIVRCVANYNMSVLGDTPGTERTAVPFTLIDGEGNIVDSSLISVTNESVSLDSLVVEQTLYTKKELVINTTDLTVGTPAEGYVIKRISCDPPAVMVAGDNAYIDALTDLHLIEHISSPIDITGATSTVCRNIRIIKSADMTYLNNDSILVTIEIGAE